jgi:hypothetical protein
MNNRSSRRITPTYVVFYILFSPDTWRILIGVILSVLVTPHILPSDLSVFGRVLIYLMVAAIGWALSGKPSFWITSVLKKTILGNNHQGISSKK